MELRLFFSTFALIFLAELGDKTQLAAMAAATGEKSTWTVFAGASLALVASTLIAVLLGDALQAVFPPRLIQGAAGVLFLIFGVVFLVSAFRAAPAAEAEVEEAPGAPAVGAGAGPLQALAFAGAAAFEEAAWRDYVRLADTVTSPALASLGGARAGGEGGDVWDGSGLAGGTEGPGRGGAPPAAPEGVGAPAAEQVTTEREDAVLRDLLRHEEAKAAFYRALADRTALPPLRQAFRALAREEDDHARRLRALAEGSVPDGGNS